MIETLRFEAQQIAGRMTSLVETAYATGWQAGFEQARALIEKQFSLRAKPASTARQRRKKTKRGKQG